MAYPMGEVGRRPVRVDRIKLEFHSAEITSDGGLHTYCELDGALGLKDIAITKLLNGRRRKESFETTWLATNVNLAVLTDLSGARIDHVHDLKPLDGIILDMGKLREPEMSAR